MPSFPFHLYGFWPQFFDDTGTADILTKPRFLETFFRFLDAADEVPLDEARLVICSVFADLEPLRELKRRRGDGVVIVQFSGEARISDPSHEFIDFTFGSDREGARDSVCPLALIYYEMVRTYIGFIPPVPPDERAFCVLVGRDLPDRRQFYDSLCQYREVDGYGQMFGRPAVGRYWDPEFVEFLSNYKFVISFENETRGAYVTEKIINPILAGAVPLYSGSSFARRLVASNRFLMLENGGEVVFHEPGKNWAYIRSGGPDGTILEISQH